MKWSVLFPGWENSRIDEYRWIDDHVNSSKHHFVKIGNPNTSDLTNPHARKSPGSSLMDWYQYYLHAGEALKSDADGVITVFPQLAVMVGLRNFFRFNRKKHIAWCFNIEKPYKGIKGILARIALARVDRFVVHSKGEIDIIHKWLSCAEKNVVFFHLQRKTITRTTPQSTTPLILSMGSSRRDYRTFLDAVEGLNTEIIVISNPKALEEIKIPSNVKVLSDISRHKIANWGRGR